MSVKKYGAFLHINRKSYLFIFIFVFLYPVGCAVFSTGTEIKSNLLARQTDILLKIPWVQCLKRKRTLGLSG
jgi:hypothetical protein